MYYKEQLCKFNNSGLDLISINVANHIKFNLDNYFVDETNECISLDITENQFEELCELTKRAYMRNDISMEELAKSTVNIFYEHKLKVDFDIEDIVENTCYMN